MTLNCIESMRMKAGKTDFIIDVIVVESEPSPVRRYPAEIITVEPKEIFNFHRYLNYGIHAAGKSDWYMLCNNDLLFDTDWLYHIEKLIFNHGDFGSISPVSPSCNDQKKILTKARTKNKDFVLGYKRRMELSGWCILVRQDTLQKIGGKLDERFDFYFADDDYAMNLRRSNILHALATNSRVYHLEDIKVSKSIRRNGNEAVLENEKIVPNRYKWILENPKMLNGFRKFELKWGPMLCVSIKCKIHDLVFLRFNIRFLSRLLFSEQL